MSQTAVAKVPGYQPQMDGLRAVAVILVLLHHYDGGLYKKLNCGPIGVRFFFVVSGFLITRILLKSRAKMDAGQTTGKNELIQFQMRRLIRTVPVYYLSLLIAAILGIAPVRESLAWTLPFLTNFYMASVGYFPDTISHFWTLAVQEQFYFFWPLLIFGLPRSWIRFSFAGLIAASLGFRLFCINTGASEIIRWFSLPGSLDSFAAGGILAYASLRNPALIVERKTRIWSGIGAVLCMLVANRLRSLPLENVLSIWIEPLEAVAMAWLIACSVTGFRGWFGRILTWRPLVGIGQISYGIYVFHVLVAILLLPTFQKLGLGGMDASAVNVRFFVQTAVTVMIAALSFHYFEKPLLKARERIGIWFSRNQGQLDKNLRTKRSPVA